MTQPTAYDRALEAERQLAAGLGGEDTVDYWMNKAAEEDQQ
ncbi:hypothetical protein OG689_10915 [Kitasatospora sp. NBC_00240]|nr:hypothetical protein [Kitasatospora sp. NBC_00240]MCX5209795.1 hypothetical protein [Kitasatospora sp. NBC_00240]